MSEWPRRVQSAAVVTAFWVYLAGVLIGLWRVDGPLAVRLGVAILWPVGVLAALVTVTGLGLVALVLFPKVGIAVAIVAAAIWLWSA